MIFYKMYFKFFTASTGNSSRRNVVWQPADFRRLPASIDNPGPVWNLQQDWKISKM